MRKKNRRLTRNSFKRKIIVFGIALFMSIAFVATGFAAWVISTNASHTSSGNVNVGVVSEADIEFKEVKIEPANFSFEPVENDETGRIRWNGTEFESLTVVVTGTVTNYQYIADALNNGLTIKLNVNENIQKAHDEGYIVLPEFTAAEIDMRTLAESLAGATVSQPDENDEVTFVIPVTIGWGEKFGFMNPSEFFDQSTINPPKGWTEEDREEGDLYITDDQMVLMLDTFKAIMHGVPVEDYTAWRIANTIEENLADKALTFDIVLSAYAN
ncbi:MAG: hypothetical protein IJW13_04525 [Clostridia bacterium]|nr:hypothetical protein [Clostridia bacterium]